MRVSNDVFAQICAEMDMLEQSGEFEQLFNNNSVKPTHQFTRTDFLHSFGAGMKLYKSTFKKIIGYDITSPGFAEDALMRLEWLGGSKARGHYEAVRSEWQEEHDKEMKSAAQWYRGQCEKEFENLKRKAVRESREEIRQMSNSELLTYLTNLIAED